MLDKVITVIVTTIVSGALGWCINQLKNYKDKLNKQKKKDDIVLDTLMTMLQTNLTNTYFAYDELKKIPDYIYRNWTNELKRYEALGGDDYVHILAKKMETWDIVRTDILVDKYEE